MAVALPVRTSIKDVYDDTCTELLVTAQLDSGEAQEGHPTFIVLSPRSSAGCSSMNICVVLLVCCQHFH